jgi:hypothetical protein
MVRRPTGPSFNKALDQVIHHAAEIARSRPDQESEHEAHAHAHEANGERNAGAVQDARQEVAAQGIRAEKEERAACAVPGAIYTDKVKVGFKQAPEPVRVAAYEETNRVAFRAVLFVHSLARQRMACAFQRVHEGSKMEAVVGEEVDPLGWCVDGVLLARVNGVRREELAEQRAQI